MEQIKTILRDRFGSTGKPNPLNDFGSYFSSCPITQAHRRAELLKSNLLQILHGRHLD